MKMWIGGALLHLNSLPGLDKLKQLKDSHPSVACTYKAFPGTTKPVKTATPCCTSAHVTKHVNLWSGDLAVIQPQSRHELWAPTFAFLLVFHKLLPRQGSDPILAEAHKGSRPAVGTGWHPAPAWVKCYPLSHSPSPPAPAAQSHPDFCIPSQLSGMASASPGTNRAAQIQCPIHTGHDCHHLLAPRALPPSQLQEHATSCAHIFFPKEALRGFFGTAHTGSEQLPLASMFTSLWLLIWEKPFILDTHTPTPSAGGVKCDL